MATAAVPGSSTTAATRKRNHRQRQNPQLCSGVNLPTSGSAIISNLNTSNNHRDGILIKECCNTLSSVTSNNNGGVGIQILSDDSNLTKVQANGNHAGGIVITSCCNTLVGSTVSKNTGVGVEMSDCCSFVVSSKIQKNSSVGVELASDDNGVIKSTISGNGDDGIEFPSSSENMVTASKSTGNAGTGIDFGPGKIWHHFRRDCEQESLRRRNYELPRQHCIAESAEKLWHQPGADGCRWTVRQREPESAVI